MAKLNKNTIQWVLIFIPYLLLIPATWYYFTILKEIPSSTFLVITKEDMSLSLYKYNGNLIYNFPIACGKAFGNKEMVGDMKTPEGVFKVGNVRDASTWSHDFKDDTLGEIKGAYGPYFIELITPGYEGIGIHGTHDPNSIGTRASEGCIRMQNQDLVKLVNHINSATVVVITPSQSDVDSTIAQIKKDENLNTIHQKKKQ